MNGNKTQSSSVVIRVRIIKTSKTIQKKIINNLIIKPIILVKPLEKKVSKRFLKSKLLL